MFQVKCRKKKKSNQKKKRKKKVTLSVSYVPLTVIRLFPSNIFSIYTKPEYLSASLIVLHHHFPYLTISGPYDETVR